MPRDYEIQVVGAAHTARSLGSIEHELQRNMFVASQEAGRLLVRHAEALQPHSREGEGAAPMGGFFFDVNGPFGRRLAGRAQGGGFLVSINYEVSLGVQDRHLGAYKEAGTGIYRDPRFGGPHTKWRIRPRRIRGRLKFIAKDGTKVLAANVIATGQRPDPWLGDVAFSAADEIEGLYNIAVREAVR